MNNYSKHLVYCLTLKHSTTLCEENTEGSIYESNLSFLPHFQENTRECTGDVVHWVSEFDVQAGVIERSQKSQARYITLYRQAQKGLLYLVTTSFLVGRVTHRILPMCGPLGHLVKDII